MTDRQCSSCGGFCKKSGCERENVQLHTKREWVGLTLEEIEDIIKSNVTITDPNLYEAVYAVAVDIEHAVLEKNRD